MEISSQSRSRNSAQETRSLSKRIPPSVIVCFVGDSHVGKTSLTERVAHDTFSNRAGPTIGGDFRSVPRKGRDGQDYMLLVRDTSGDETYRCIIPMFFRGVQVAILVFDLTSRASLNSMPFWAATVRKHEVDNLRALLLCGNKTDLVDEDRLNAVSRRDGRRMARRLNCHGYFETSALTGFGVTELVYKVIECGQREEVDADQLMSDVSQNVRGSTVKLTRNGPYLASPQWKLPFASCCK